MGGDRGRVPLGYFKKYVIIHTVSLSCYNIFTPIVHLATPLVTHVSGVHVGIDFTIHTVGLRLFDTHNSLNFNCHKR